MNPSVSSNTNTFIYYLQNRYKKNQKSICKKKNSIQSYSSNQENRTSDYESPYPKKSNNLDYTNNTIEFNYDLLYDKLRVTG